MNDDEDCEHARQVCTVTTVKSIYDVEQDDGVWLLVPEDFENPDSVGVELNCPDCGRQNLLTRSEWEVA